MCIESDCNYPRCRAEDCLVGVTTKRILLDLAPLTPAQCAARGIRHSSTDDHSTAVRSDDPDWLLQGALRAAGRKFL